MTPADGQPKGLSSADWAGETSQRWAAQASRFEAMLAPVDDVLLPAAAIAPGEHVLDIGCGRGVTTRAAAALTGPGGAVTGVDISPTLIGDAGAAPASPDTAPITWIDADAATHRFPPAGFDLAISRFGVMFFDDPFAAFVNLGTATKPAGRFVSAVWPPRDTSEFQSLSIDVALRVARDRGHRLDPGPGDTGPYAFGASGYAADVLERAGWIDIDMQLHELPLYVGGPGTEAAETVSMGLGFGPLAILTQDAPTEIVAAISDALTSELASRWDGTGIPLQATIAIVTATRPAHD